MFGIISLVRVSTLIIESMDGQDMQKMDQQYHLQKVVSCKYFQIFFYKLFLDIRRRAVVYIKKIFKNINLKFSNGTNKKYSWKERPLAKLLQLNHPNNCHDIDILRLTKNLTGFHQIQINLRKDPRYKIEIIMEDKKQSLSRTYKYNKFGNSGPRIFLNNLTKNHYKYILKIKVICHYRCLFHRYYAAEFEQRIFVEGDPKNRCNDYKETTYEDCDRKFVKDFFFNNIPNFMPIWATHNYSQVTKFWNTSRRISDMYDDIVTGGTKSGIRVK